MQKSKPKLPDRIYVDKGIINSLVTNGGANLNLKGDKKLLLVRNDNYQKKCWLCGCDDITMHHVIPKIRNPRHNIKIPLCRKCHDSMHSHNMLKGIREIVYFENKLQPNGKTKLIGRIQNGKICMPDRGYNGNVKPNKFYDCKIFQLDNVAFARDIKEFKIMENKEIVYVEKPKEIRMNWVRM